MKSFNDMDCIHDNEVNTIAEFKLINGILNPSKNTNNIKIYYYPVMHVSMNTRKGKAIYIYILNLIRH